MPPRVAADAPFYPVCALAVEAAEEKLVDATEQAINLMRSVLENPEPIKNLHALLQAQQAFYAEASEAISSVLGEVEEAGTAAEADWRCVTSGFRLDDPNTGT